MSRPPKRPPTHWFARNFSWAYAHDNLYDIYSFGKVILCVKAYGPNAFVVDKHRTAMVAKSTTNLDRYDRQEERWTETSASAHAWTDENLIKTLNEMAAHHERYLAKLIVE